MFETTVGDLMIYEGATAFYIVDLTTKEEKCMGDMVDAFSTADGESVYVGTEEFYQLLTNDLKSNPSSYREAYFPEEPERVGYCEEEDVYYVTDDSGEAIQYFGDLL